MKLPLPLLTWALALCTLAGAAHTLHRRQDQVQARAALDALPMLRVSSQPLALSDYQAIQARTTAFGAVELRASAGALLIRAATLSDYAAWRLTIAQVLLDNPGVVWRIDQLCSGACAAGEAHRAMLVGRRISNLQPGPAAHTAAAQRP